MQKNLISNVQPSVFTQDNTVTILLCMEADHVLNIYRLKALTNVYTEYLQNPTGWFSNLQEKVYVPQSSISVQQNRLLQLSCLETINTY